MLLERNMGKPIYSSIMRQENLQTEPQDIFNTPGKVLATSPNLNYGFTYKMAPSNEEMFQRN